MFSENGWISGKQVRRMLVLPVFAGCIFTLPYMAARLYGGNVVLGLGIFLVLAALYSGVIYWLGEYVMSSEDGGRLSGANREKKDTHIEDEDGSPTAVSAGTVVAGKGKRWIACVHLLRLTIRLAFYVLLAITILGEAQVPFMKEGGAARVSNLLVVLPLLLVSFYGAAHSMEKVARIHEMVFWVTFVPFLVLLALGLREVNWQVWIPEGGMSIWKMILYGYLLLTFVLPVENYLQLRKVSVQKWNKTVPYWSVLATLLLSALLSMLIVGIYGIHGAAGEEMVTISIMRYIRMPLGVLERLDVLMIWFFMTGCFVLVCNTLFYVGDRYRTAFGRKGTVWVMSGALVLALLLAYWFPKYEVSIVWFLWYGAVIDLPLSLILPVFDQGIRRRHHQKTDTQKQLVEKEGKSIRQIARGNVRKAAEWKAGRHTEKVSGQIVRRSSMGCARSCRKRIRERMKRRRKERKGLCFTEKLCMWLFAGCLACVLLTGCGQDMRNVEQRDYATMMVISRGEEVPYHIYLGIAKEHRVGEQSQVEGIIDLEAESLTQLQKVYSRQRGKDLSLAHIKIVLWDMQAFAHIEDMTAFLYEMDENGEVAKTCPVLLLEDTKAWLTYAKEAQTPVGTYVSDLVRSFDTGDRRVPWLKDYLQYIREGDALAPCVLVNAKQGFQVSLAKTRYQLRNVE